MASVVRKLRLCSDAAWRLGPRAVALAAWGKGPGRWWAVHRLGCWVEPLAGEDLRPVWEANRWAGLVSPEHLCPEWMAANPPFQGPNWACGQEAALRALHLALALPRPPPGWAAPILAAHARRIGANPAYAMAQDNNHPVSEAAGLLACGLVLGSPGMAARGHRRLEAAVARLVAADGGFAQVSPAYLRLLVEVLAAAQMLRRAWDGPPASPPLLARARAATALLRRLACPWTGALPRIGHQDGSAFFGTADDARPGLELAEALFGAPPLAAEWRAQGLRGWASEGARAVLRVGPLPFRPAHADLLHLDLWDGADNLLRDGGTAAYNPAPENAWWLEYFWSARAHNTVQFGAAEPMPRVGRFLHAHWPRTGRDGDTDWVRHHAGHRHARAVSVRGREWLVRDEVSGPEPTLRWRLGPGAWRLTPDGAQGPAHIAITADAPLAITLEPGWESLAYGQVSPCPVLVARGAVGWFETRITLPPCGTRGHGHT